ncbi:MAG: hypothetical protein IJ660_05260 [Alphaproteobacteria bacterium]|nr:hypothetical protein [Alphaproteobacteria bacterium]
MKGSYEMSCNQEIRKQLAQEFVKLRERRGITLEKLLQNPKLTHYALRCIENDKSISWRQCNRLFKYFRCRVEVRLFDSD